MDKGWKADVTVEPRGDGRFAASLVLTPPPAVGPPIRVPIAGEYSSALEADTAARAALDSMIQGS